MTGAAQRVRRIGRGVVGAATSPLRNYIDRQFTRVDQTWDSRMGDLQHRLDVDIEAAAEWIAESDMRRVIGRSPAEITQVVADLANWLTGNEGFVAQAHLWLNQGIATTHRLGGVDLVGINERVIEVPYVLQALGELNAPSRIFDLGSLESLLPLQLAALGHLVTALDLHPYPFPHPGIESVACPIQDWPDPRDSFDAVISLSALEHMGLESYGQGERAERLDCDTMRRFQRWLRPGGLLLFTAPYGSWYVDGFQRIYDNIHLAELLEGFRVLDRRYAIRSAGIHWTVCSEPPDPTVADGQVNAVVLLKATPET